MRGAADRPPLLPAAPDALPARAAPHSGTNYVMWFPYTRADSNMRFRFLLQHEALGQARRRGPADDAPPDAPAAATA